MGTRWIWVGAALLATVLSAGPACKSSETTDGAGAGVAQTSTSSTGGNGLTCASYCNKIMANCKLQTQQYTNEANCLASCPAFPAGEPGADKGNSLGCRTYHAGVAQDDPGTHCAHAGPGGDDVCGSPCTGYCEIVLAACTGDNQVYADAVSCQAACKKRKTDIRYSIGVGIDAGDELACLLFYAQEAAGAPGEHCADLAEATTPCREGGAGVGGGGGATAAGGAGGVGGAGGAGGN